MPTHADDQAWRRSDQGLEGCPDGASPPAEAGGGGPSASPGAARSQDVPAELRGPGRQAELSVGPSWLSASLGGVQRVGGGGHVAFEVEFNGLPAGLGNLAESLGFVELGKKW